MAEQVAQQEPRQAANLVTSENRAEFMAKKLDLASTSAPAQEAPADDAAKADAEKAPEQAAEPKGEQAEEAKADAPTKEGDKKEAKKHELNVRFSELTAKRKEAEAKAESERQARLAAEAEAAELRARLTPPKPAQADPEPQRAQFASDGEYLKAMTDWSVEHALADRDRKAAEAREAEVQTQRATAWQERVAAAQQDIPEFSEKIAASKAVVSDQVRDAIFESEVGPRILLHFAEHPEEAARIAKLTVGGALREIGRLEARLEAPAKGGTVTPKPEERARVEISRAPAPITPLKGNGAAPESPIDAKGEFHGDYATWKAARKAGKIK